jgi:hydrophobic surface binding protein A
MQLKNILSFGLMAGAVLAQAPAAAPPTNPVAKTLSTISDSLELLSKDIIAWTGEVVAGSNILMKAQDLLAVIDKSVGDVKSQQVMALNDAVNILKPGNNVVKKTQEVVDALISKKPAVDKAGLSPVVKDTFTKFKTSATALINAVQSKLPDNVKAVADSIGKQINAALDKAVTAYA